MNTSWDSDYRHSVGLKMCGWKGDTVYPTNQRKSTRYTIFTFLPYTLLYQMFRLVNLFYLLNGCL